ncbi:FAD dependent oxidoreductase [Amylocarpus encephaloides]|uniref:FAD dependent oxidoreductase n=1 Tax=Amylocarpus encephaloides TaxID=45428 RepID=A0A9P8C1U7_9HELO|nr:FAD dependent oxidoreductase [Amylocarpus encephaloides]
MAPRRKNNENHFDFAIAGGGMLWSFNPSRDTSKIIRATYDDEDYVAFAEKALRMWATNKFYSEFYHQTGWVQVVSEGSHANIVKGPKDTMISIGEMQERVRSREEPNLIAGEELRLNEDIGYIDCDLAVEAVAEEASRLGVTRVKKDVTKLRTEGGICLVEAADDCITATTTVVAVGPWTPGLLERSQIAFPKDFFTVAGVGVATMSLSEDEFHELKAMPILVTEGGEVIVSEKHKVLKMTTTGTFRIGHPDELVHLKSIDIGKNRAVLEKMLPQFTKRQLDSWVCPDLMTPYQHPLVDYIPGNPQICLAVGGSYHSAKFLPNFGSMVVRLLRGQIDLDTPEGRLLKRWSWDRSTEKVAIHRSVVPKDS